MFSRPQAAGWASLLLLPLSVLAGGLREPRLAAVGAAAAALLAAASAPLPLGAAIWWLPWLGWAALSCALSAQPWAGLPVLGRWGAFAVFLALAQRWDAARRRAWLVLFCGLGALLAGVALWTGWPHGFGHEMKGLLPPYYNYTIFAVSAACAACAACAASAVSEVRCEVRRQAQTEFIFHARARSAALWILAAALAVTVLLSRSRGGLLGLSAAAAWLAWRRGGWKSLCAVAAVALLGLAAAPEAWRESLLKRARLRGEARPAIWSRAKDLALDKPWLGEGPGNFAVGFRRRPVPVPGAPARFGLWTPYAHSEPLQVAAETGIAGLALWLLGLGGTLGAAFRRAGGGGSGSADPVAEAARAGLLAATVHLLFDNVLQLTGLSFFYASLLAVVAGARPGPGPSLPRVGGLALAAFALAGALPGVLAAPAPPEASPERKLQAAALAARIYPADAERREDLAWLLQLYAAPNVAAEQWVEAERLAPFNAVYPWRLGVLRRWEGRLEEAEAAFSRALADEPGFLAARADRVVALAGLGRRDEAAIELAELKRRAALSTTEPESGYERTIARLEFADLRRAEHALKPPRSKAARR